MAVETVVVVLSNPWDGHEPGEKVTVTAEVAADLRRGGIIPSDPSPLASPPAKKAAKASSKSSRKSTPKKAVGGTVPSGGAQSDGEKSSPSS